MRYLRPRWHVPTALVGLGAVAFAWLCATAPCVRAQQVDPVEQLKSLLPTPFSIDENDAALKVREAACLKQLDEIKSIGDLRRALMLSEWKDNDRLNPKLSASDRRIRTAIGSKFSAIINNVVDNGDSVSKVAVCALLGDMGAGVRSLDPNDAGGYCRSLAPSLIKLSSSKDPQVVQEAARALGKINPPVKDAVPALTALLNNPNPGARQAASSALVELVTTIAQLQKKGRAQTGVDATKADVISVSAAVVPAAGQASQSPDAITRRNGLDAIGQAGAALNDLIPDPFEAEKFPPATRPWDELEKRKVNDARNELKGEYKLFEPLLIAFQGQGNTIAGALQNSDDNTRVLARRALEWIGSSRLRLIRRDASVPTPATDPAPEAPDLLKKALEPGLLVISRGMLDPDIRVRRATLDFLETMEDAAAPAVPYLVKALSDSDRFIRWAAARTLGRVGPVQTELTVPALARLLGTQEDVDVRETAGATLRRYGKAARAAIPSLIADIANANSESRESSIKALISVGPEAADAVPALQNALQSSVANVRKLAAEALGRMGPLASAAVPDLRRRLDDDDNAVRIAASAAILSIVPLKQ